MELTKLTTFPKKLTETISHTKSLLLSAAHAGTMGAHVALKKIGEAWEVMNPAANLYYAGLGALAVAAVMFGGYIYTRPHTYVNSDEAAIICSNNKIYSAKENNIRTLDALYAYAKGEQGTANHALRSEDAKARKLCAYGIINDFFPYRQTPSEINYEVRLASPLRALPPQAQKPLLSSS